MPVHKRTMPRGPTKEGLPCVADIRLALLRVYGLHRPGCCQPLKQVSLFVVRMNMGLLQKLAQVFVRLSANKRRNQIKASGKHEKNEFESIGLGKGSRKGSRKAAK